MPSLVFPPHPSRNTEHRIAHSGASADHLCRLLNALPAAVVVLDGRGRVSEANPAAVELLGEALEGRFWRDIVQEVFRADMTGADLVLLDGRMVTLMMRPLVGEPGQVLLLQDITEERHLEARLNHSRRLEDMGRMAATLAHQVRTPLASALLYISHLNRPDLPNAKRLEFSGKALSCLRDLERLVNDMLAYARGEIGQGESLVAAELLTAALEEASTMLINRGITVRFEDGSKGAVVRVNPALLRTALLNLINNAIQAMPDGGYITLSAVPMAPAAVDLVVADQGEGIPFDQLAKIFEPFATGREGGTGLGLAVVRTVARAHGGEAWAESVPGQGSRVGIRLPVLSPGNGAGQGGH